MAQPKPSARDAAALELDDASRRHIAELIEESAASHGGSCSGCARLRALLGEPGAARELPRRPGLRVERL